MNKIRRLRVVTVIIILLSVCLLLSSINKGNYNSSEAYDVFEVGSLNSPLSFSFLAEELKDKSIVVLGEALHSDGSVFEAKSSIVDYLHNRLLFNSILFEVSFYDVWLCGNENSSLTTRDAFYSFWRDSDQMHRFWNNKDLANMRINGIDTQFSGNIVDSLRFKPLFQFLKSNGVDAKKEWPYFYEISDSVTLIVNNRWLGKQIGEKRITNAIMDLDSMVTFISNADPQLEMSIIMSSMLKGLSEWWKCTLKYDIGDLRRFEIRDSLMFEAADKIITNRLSHGDKVILWVSNLHAFKNNHLWEDKRVRFKNLGERLDEKYGKELHTILFTSFSRENRDDKNCRIAPFNSLEHKLHLMEKGDLYLNEKSLNRMGGERSGVNQALYYKSELHKMTNSLIFIDTTANVTYNKNN